MVFAGLTFFYVSRSLSKSAFIATLLRVSKGKTAAFLWFLTLIVWLFNIAIIMVTWVPVCDENTEIALPSACASITTLTWVHMSNAVATILVDFALASVPWITIKKIYIPPKEKWAVATSMSLVGLAPAIAITG